MLRLSWPTSLLVAAAWYVLYVVDVIQDLRTELAKRKKWRASC